MSEKRFELAYEQDDWWAVKDGDITLWKEEVVDLLNELSEENEKLRFLIDINSVSERTKLERQCDKQQATIEQLQDLCGKSDGENAKLRIENEQLKKYCTVLKNQIKKMGEIGGFNKHMLKTILESNYDD